MGIAYISNDTMFRMDEEVFNGVIPDNSCSCSSYTSDSFAVVYDRAENGPSK